jgi:hypothetical protein
MKQEVAELSGNFCRELSVPETGEGILMFFARVKTMKHPAKCIGRPSRTGIAKVRKIKEVKK